MKTLLNRKKGFTLIELMIVVAIIGILAAIAIPNFLRFQLKAKSSEGKTNLAAIRTAEQSYYSEFGSYISASPDPAMADIGSSKVTFNGTTGFDTIGWSPEGSVYFSYAVNGDGTNAALDHTAFRATAMANIDADATNQGWQYLKTSTATPAAYATHTCASTVEDQVVPCAPTHGQSVF